MHIRFLSAHLEADVLEVTVEVVQHSATVEYEGRLQHLLVNLLIVQFLQWNTRGMKTLRFHSPGSQKTYQLVEKCE